MCKKFNFKEYYESNPEFRARHLEKLKEKVTCECGASVVRSHLCRHKKTNAHMNKINAQKKEQEISELDKLKIELTELRQMISKNN